MPCVSDISAIEFSIYRSTVNIRLSKGNWDYSELILFKVFDRISGLCFYYDCLVISFIIGIF